jgi:hypothetical protein
LRFSLLADRLCGLALHWGLDAPQLERDCFTFNRRKKNIAFNETNIRFSPHLGIVFILPEER